MVPVASISPSSLHCQPSAQVWISWCQGHPPEFASWSPRLASYLFQHILCLCQGTCFQYWFCHIIILLLKSLQWAHPHQKQEQVQATNLGSNITSTENPERHVEWMSEWKSISCVQVFVILWPVALQAPLSMEFSRQEYWGGWPFPSPGDLSDPGVKPRSPVLQADSYCLGHQGSPGDPCTVVIILVFKPQQHWVSPLVRNDQLFQLSVVNYGFICVFLL